MQIKLDITGQQMRDMERSFKKLGEETKAKIEVLVKQVSLEAANDAKENVNRNKSVNTGLLQNGISHVMMPSKSGWEVTGEINSKQNYSTSVEYGRAPGSFPFIGDGSKANGGIRYWVKRKFKLKDTGEVNRVAYLVARKIQREGINPKPFMRPAYEKWAKRFDQEAIKILGK
jgi:hypothetical protein